MLFRNTKTPKEPPQMIRNNQRPPNFTDWQILQLKRTYSSLRTLNSQVFRELQRIRRMALTRSQYRDAGQFFQMMAIRMISAMRVREAIVVAAREQVVNRCEVIIGPYCECSAIAPDDNESVSNEALKIDPAHHEEVDSLLELMLRANDREPGHCGSRRVPPECFFVGLDRIISAVLRQQRQLQRMSFKQGPTIEVINIDRCPRCGSTGDETVESTID
jgi:hypothetical protein